MAFAIIDREHWVRREYFDHYFSAVPCAYSMTVKLDITRLRAAGVKLYPAMLHCLARVVNRHEEFRTAFDEHGNLGIYDCLHPCYTVFHDDTETFSTIWTAYQEAYAAFEEAYRRDTAAYGGCRRFEAKPDTPANAFNVSMLPWESFESFHLHLPRGNDYLLPIFTMGRFYEEKGRVLLPLAVQVHHAVCDGFHVCRFIQELRQLTA